VLVRVEAASVNPVDVAVREDRFPTPKQPPKTLGSDGAGVVEAVGPGVSDVVPGEEVFFSGLGVGSEGSYAEYAVIAEAQAVTKPPELSFVEAAAIGMTFPAAYYGLVIRGDIREGETVLIQGGGGGVGTAAIQLAKARGARVLTTVTGERARQVVTELGADGVIDFREQDVAAEVERLTDGRGPDLIHELVISENLPADVRMVAKGGRIVCTGQGPRPDGSVPIGPAIAKDVTLLFMNLANAGRAGIAAIAAELAALAAEGVLRPVVGETLPLSEARKAHELLEGEHVGKIVLVPGG
jgi:NADPH:quinone reductase